MNNPNEDFLISKLPYELRLMYYAFKLLQKIGGTGSIEVHFLRGKIKENNGMYIKPGIDGQVVDKMIELVEEEKKELIVK